MLTWVFRLVPLFCVTHTINFQASKDALRFFRPDLTTDEWSLIHSGGDILFLCLHFCFWTLVITLCELPALKKINP